MSEDVKTKNGLELEALLDFYVAAGVDYALDDEPNDRFAETVKARKASLAKHAKARAESVPNPTRPPPLEAPRQTPMPRPQPKLADAETLEDARQLGAKADSLDALRTALEAFDGCNLKRTAKNLVFGDGNPQAKLMFIGEAPGRDEDISGIPFVGRSGELLNRMIEAIGLTRQDDVYIANIVPWRPPGNRNPTPQETELCRPFIERQITLVNPDIIVPLGAPSSRQLLATADGIMKLRGRAKPYQLPDREITAIPTLHPAYLLRQPGQKRLAWQDFLLIKQTLQEKSEQQAE